VKKGEVWFLDIFIYSVFVFALLFYVSTAERTLVLDNDNYISYFSHGDLISDFIYAALDGKEVVKSILRFFTEEFVWLVFASAVGGFLSPDVAVVFTVVLINLMVAYSLWRLGVGPLGLLLWCVFPVCFAVVGYFQIRQGLAIGVFFCWVVAGFNPLVGALLASMIHTTFLVPLLVAVILAILPSRVNLYHFCFAVVFLCFAIFFGVQDSFSELAGRRSETYDVSEGAESLNFVIGIVILVSPSFYVAIFRDKFSEIIVSISMLHIGISIWLVLAFFVFPLGTARVAYYAQVFSIFSGVVVFLSGFRYSLFVSFFYWLIACILVYGGIRDDRYSQLGFSWFF
jgi:hypothetical protein